MEIFTNCPGHKIPRVFGNVALSAMVPVVASTALSTNVSSPCGGSPSMFSDRNFYELPRPQNPARVRKRRLERDGSGRRVHRVVHERQFAMRRLAFHVFRSKFLRTAPATKSRACSETSP